MRKQKKQPILEQVLVENYAAEGKALARVDGKVVFIEGAVPGDVVDVQLKKNKTDWAEGFVVALGPILKTASNHFVRILVYAVDVSGRCFLMQNNSCINNSK